MNLPDSTDEKLAVLLRATGCEPLPDDGFTAHVLAALPTKRLAPRLLRRDWIIGGIAVALVLVLAPRSAATDLRAVSTQAGDSLVNLLNSLLEDPVGLAVIALTAGVLLLTELDEEPSPARPEN